MNKATTGSCASAVCQAPWGLIAWSPGPSRCSLFRHDERVELVAVRIAEVTGVKASATVARCALVLAAIGERDVVKPVDLVFVLGRKRDHDAVADRRRIAVEGLGDTDTGTAIGLAPGDELL